LIYPSEACGRPLPLAFGPELVLRIRNYQAEVYPGSSSQYRFRG
jgi:hypothetical protein